jgi:hypothetical protein
MIVVVKRMALALAIVAGGALSYGAVVGVRPALAKDLDMKKIFRCSATDKPGVDACDKARALILDNCTTCHPFVPIVLQQFDEDGWTGLIDRHRDRVGQLNRDEITAVRAYLAANFNPSKPPPDLPPDLVKEWTAY